MTAARLTVQLESGLPGEIEVGGGTALFVCGTCFSPQAAIASLELVLDGAPQPVMAHSMPRLDPLNALGDPQAYHSGFWGIVRVPGDLGARAAGPLRLSLRAELRDGASAEAELGRIALRQRPEPPPVAGPPPRGGGPLVAICLATYEPPADLLARQLHSIRAQTHAGWVCLISDDCSSASGHAVIERAIAGDERFRLSRSPRRLGFYANFERALAMAPTQAAYVALSDQDDVWHPDKLESLIGAIGEAQLVYSDARVVDRAGNTLAETWWQTRANNHSDMLSLLVANSVSGAASLMRRDLLDDALPFPPGQFAHFHDHWLALVALARGEIAFVERPLFDYVQHAGAELGHEASNRLKPLGARVRERRPLRDRIRAWRLHYFLDACRLLQFAAVLQMRCGERMTRGKRHALRRLQAADRSWWPLPRLALRGLWQLARPGRTETLGAEWMVALAFAWRRLLRLTVRARPGSRWRLDAVPPPSLVQPPGRRSLTYEPARTMAEKIAPLNWQPSDQAPERVNLLIPGFDLRHFFGGYIAKLNLARRLAESGRRVRVITVDPVGALPADWRARVEGYAGLDRLFQSVEVAFGRESPGIEVSRRDRFVATTWWTAHIAAHATRLLDAERFAYLVQEYEPLTVPMGSWAALAEQSYRFAHFGLFSSQLLRDYFRIHRAGVYAEGVDAGERLSASFQNAITRVEPPAIGELAARRTRRLLVYARPEAHAARNLFELGVLALSRAVESGAFRDGWELHGIGTVEGPRRVSLADGLELSLLPRRDQAAYADTLRSHDVGLALMYTPHPSLVPLEMAAAGMLAVTNSFENKTADALGAISGNLIVAEPGVEEIAAALMQAAGAADDHRRRIEGSRVSWSRSWEEAFSDALLERVLGALG